MSAGLSGPTRKAFRASEVLIVALCGTALLGLSFFIFVEVVARKLFNYSFQGVDEIGGYAVAITSAFGFAIGLADRGHTRVDLFVARLPLVVKGVLNVVAYATTAIAALGLTYAAWTALSETLLFNSHAVSPLRTPLWIPQGLWFAGFCAFAGMALILAGHALVTAIADPVRGQRLYGASSAAEEAEQATVVARRGAARDD